MLIDLLQARKGLHEKCAELFHNEKVAESIYMYLCDGIEECDAVEPERMNGEWIHKPDIYLDEQTWECSECGEPWIFIEGTPSENNANYCPNCGADMRGDNND